MFIYVTAALLAGRGMVYAQVPASSGTATAPSPEAAQTLVVFNNLLPASVDLAGYYAEKRGIPYDHLIGLDCSMSEEIGREEYDRTIAEPLRKTLSERGWWELKTSGSQTRVVQNQIRFVVLIFGVPLKIAPVKEYEGDTKTGPQNLAEKNEASVDSELATLGYFTRTISGPLTNPYFQSYLHFRDENLPMLMLVCRLDAPTPAIVRRMIDDSIAVEKNGLRGFAWVDARGLTSGALVEGDTWLDRLAQNARKRGIPVVEDKQPAMFPEDYPMTHAAWYFGWYSEQAAGPFARDDFHFTPGAVAVHLHSFSGSTVRDSKHFWVGPLLEHGADATLGNVYEPFLQFTPNLDVFFDRLVNGFTFAESGYMSERVVSWMTTFVGDPLYRPCGAAIESGSSSASMREKREWLACREGALLWFDKSRAAGEKRLQQAARSLHSGIVWEELGLLQASAGDADAALGSYKQAIANYNKGEDMLRVCLDAAEILKTKGKTKEALALLQKCERISPQARGAGLVCAFEIQLAPPSPTPSPSPSPSPSATPGRVHSSKKSQ